MSRKEYFFLSQQETEETELNPELKHEPDLETELEPDDTQANGTRSDWDLIYS